MKLVPEVRTGAPGLHHFHLFPPDSLAMAELKKDLGSCNMRTQSGRHCQLPSWGTETPQTLRGDRKVTPGFCVWPPHWTVARGDQELGLWCGGFSYCPRMEVVLWDSSRWGQLSELLSVPGRYHNIRSAQSFSVAERAKTPHQTLHVPGSWSL